MWHTLVNPWDRGSRVFQLHKAPSLAKTMTSKVSFLVIFWQTYRLRTWKVSQTCGQLTSRESLLSTSAVTYCDTAPGTHQAMELKLARMMGWIQSNWLQQFGKESHHALIILIWSLIIYLHSVRLCIQTSCCSVFSSQFSWFCFVLFGLLLEFRKEPRDFPLFYGCINP